LSSAVAPDARDVAPVKTGARWVVCALLALGLASCGFQLRGEPAVGIRTLLVSSVGGSGVAAEIRRTLATGPTRLVANPKDAEAHLQVLHESHDKTVHTISGTGRVYEFQLTLAVTYQMTMPGREMPVIEPTEVLSRRVITYSEKAPTAKEAEELLLYKDMQSELAGRILRQVALALPRQGGEGRAPR
jgi:LPS-assembly lipoprotein